MRSQLTEQAAFVTRFTTERRKRARCWLSLLVVTTVVASSTVFDHGRPKHIELCVNPRWTQCFLQIDPALAPELLASSPLTNQRHKETQSSSPVPLPAANRFLSCYMSIQFWTLGLALTIPAPLPAQTAEELIRRGDAAYAALDNATAIESYRKAVDRTPSDPVPLIRLARVQNDEGRLALRRSDSSEVFYRRALVTAETLAVRFPDRAESWFLLALCHGSLVPFKSIREKINIGRDVEANLRRALAIDSTHAMSYVLLGIYYRSAAQLSWMERTLVNTILGKHIIGTLTDSEQALRTAIRLAPDSPYAYFELAATLRASGREDEAMASLKTVVSLPYIGAREKLQVDDAYHRLQRWQVATGAGTAGSSGPSGAVGTGRSSPFR